MTESRCPNSVFWRRHQSVSHETSSQTFILSSPHLDVRKIAALPLALGVAGLITFSHTPLRTSPIRPSISLILLSHVIMLRSLHLGPPRGPVSVLGYLLSERRPSLPSPLPLITHPLYLRSKLRFSTHVWPSTLLSVLHVCSPTPKELAYPLTTSSPPSSIHSWMVRTCLLFLI